MKRNDHKFNTFFGFQKFSILFFETHVKWFVMSSWVIFALCFWGCRGGFLPRKMLRVHWGCEDFCSTKVCPNILKYLSDLQAHMINKTVKWWVRGSLDKNNTIKLMSNFSFQNWFIGEIPIICNIFDFRTLSIKGTDDQEWMPKLTRIIIKSFPINLACQKWVIW